AFAASALWQQWRGVEVESAERGRQQAGWILTGGLDWARLILREDGRAGGPDHPGEPWAMPLKESRLSTFLSADSQVLEDDRNAFLSGQIVDLQSRMNISNLILGNTVSLADLRAFERLYAQLGLPAGELQSLADQLRLAVTGAAAGESAVPLRPRNLAQLAWLGLPESSIRKLAPFVTLLPERTPVNINTASAEVLEAVIAQLDQAGAQRLVAARAQAPFQQLSDATPLLGTEGVTLNAGAHSIDSHFFEARARLRIDQLTVEERSLLQRQGLTVTALSRERGVVPELAAFLQ
ncbi:MAG: general secretion pathway protein GspK, partial [Comamonadaceae bacterium]